MDHVCALRVLRPPWVATASAASHTVFFISCRSLCGLLYTDNTPSSDEVPCDVYGKLQRPCDSVGKCCRTKSWADFAAIPAPVHRVLWLLWHVDVCYKGFVPAWNTWTRLLATEKWATLPHCLVCFQCYSLMFWHVYPQFLLSIHIFQLFGDVCLTAIGCLSLCIVCVYHISLCATNWLPFIACFCWYMKAGWEKGNWKKKER